MLKIFSLLLPFLLIFPAYAQGQSFDEQLTSTDENSKIVTLTQNLENELNDVEKRIDELDKDHDDIIIKFNSLQNLELELNQKITQMDNEIIDLKENLEQIALTTSNLQTQITKIENDYLININSKVGTILNKVTYDALGITSIALGISAIVLAGLIFNRQNRQNTNIENLVRGVNDILRTDKELKDSKKEHEEKELVHALIFTRSRLQVIENTVEKMDEEKVFSYSEIETNWKSMERAPFEKLDDIVKGSGVVIDSEVKSQVSVIKGQLKSDLSEILQPYTVLIQIGGIIRLIDGLLTNQLNSQRLEIIAEKRTGLKESIAFGRSQGHEDSELTSVRMFHEAEIRKYTMPDDEGVTST